MSLETASTVIARKAFICEAYHCDNMIDPGEEYARHVAFPGHQAWHIGGASVVGGHPRFGGWVACSERTTDDR